MAIVHRRTFFGKAGAGGQLVQHIKEGHDAFKRYGLTVKTRVLSDYLSGRTDRVVAEWEADGLADIENGMKMVMGGADAQKFFEGWFKKLTDLIDHAEVESWTVE